MIMYIMSRPSKLTSLLDVTCVMTDNFQYPSQSLDIDRSLCEKKQKKPYALPKTKRNNKWIPFYFNYGSLSLNEEFQLLAFPIYY